MLPILILAAGSSRRMQGTDKLLAKVDGVPLLRIVAERALSTGHPVYVALPQRPHQRYEVLNGLDITQVPVKDAARGMSLSLAKGVSRLPRTTEAVLILLADMPDIRRRDMREVIAARDSHPDALIWRGSDRFGKAGHPVLIDASLFPEVRKLKGDTGAQSIIAAHSDRVHLVKSVGEASHTDLDTPEAWKAWHYKRSR